MCLCATDETPVPLGCPIKLTTQGPCPISQLVLASLSGWGLGVVCDMVYNTLSDKLVSGTRLWREREE